MQRLSIGEMSKLSNVSIQALRYYDQIGLFKPAFIEENSGYRYYELEQLFYLDIIKYLRHLKLPLKDIKKIVNVHLSQLNKLLDQQDELIDLKIARLLEIKRALKHQQQQLTTQISKKKRPLDQVYRIHENEISLLQKDTSMPLTPLDTPDKEIRALVHQFEQAHLVASLQYGFLYPLKKYNELSEIKYSKMIMPVYEHFNFSSDFELSTIPETDWLVISFKWTTKNYLKYYQKLVNHYQQMFGLSTNVNVYEISMPLTYSITGNSEFITELKIPLE